MPWQQLRTPSLPPFSLPDTVRVAVTSDDFYFIFWLQTCLTGCFGSVVMHWGFLALSHRALLCTSHALLGPTTKAAHSPGPGELTISVLRGQPWASPVLDKWHKPGFYLLEPDCAHLPWLPAGFQCFPHFGWHRTSSCSQSGPAGLHKPPCPDTSKGLRWPCFTPTQETQNQLRPVCCLNPLC